AELKLSGLAKRDRDGNLVVRNRIYRRLFDRAWVASTRSQRAAAVTRRYALAASFAFLVLAGGGGTYYATIIRPDQKRLDTLDRLADAGVSITRNDDGTIRALLSLNTTQSLLNEIVPLLNSLGSVTEVGFAEDRGKPDVAPGQRIQIAIDDLSPFADL